jgi:F-type H+-transporting ATPase subunit delta
MSNETVARRYAAALADVVTKSGETETVKSELKIWQEMIESSGDLKNALHNPSIPHQSKEKVLMSLLERAKPTTTTANFLRVLLSNDRLTELREINDRFDYVLAERSGLMTADITSARPLGDAEKLELKANLETLTGKKVNLNFNIKEELIGGVVTRIGSTVYDNSVKTQLENLKEQIING